MAKKRGLLDAFGMAIAAEPHPDPLHADGTVDPRCHAGVHARLVWPLALPIAILLPALDDLDEALTGRGAAAVRVEHPRDGDVSVLGGEPPEQRDRVLVAAER
jgi:hypothetical protein